VSTVPGDAVVAGDGELPSFGPLAGVRVLDVTVALAGAFATMLLADLGAEVIKVESRQHYSQPSRGPRVPPTGDDPASFSFRRDYADGDPGKDPWNRISWFNSHARNKRDVTMDLTRPEGRELFLRLVERSDGFVENNAPGLLERLDLGPDVLLARNPRLIVVRMPPLGLSGPDMKATGFGWHFEELSGLLSMQGYADGESVVSIFMDGASGPAGANAFLMALLERRRTGRGTVVEVAQVENLTVHIGDLVMDAAMNDRVPRRWGNRSPDFVPQGVYPCAGEDQWLALSVRDDGEWAALRAVLGDPPTLAGPELGTPGGRRAAHDAIDAVISAWTATRTKGDAFHRLQAAGVPAGPVMDEADAMADPQLAERGFFPSLHHPSAGTHRHPGANFRLNGTPTVFWRAAPVTGQDNHAVYRELLGLSAEEYDALVASGHIGDSYV
jgi:crotonobetainyl-CoA:carnitine CoA-transferase CaiB-like acyl-CoA transferase